MSVAPQLTYSGLGLAVFAQQLCLPVPSVLLLIAAGALAASGTGHLHLSLVILSSVAGCLAADGFWFWLGRQWGTGVIRVVCSLTSDPRASRERASRVFEKWGLRLLLVAKLVPGLDCMAPPLAGAGGAPLSGFLAYDAAGALLWTGVYVLLGFVFTTQLHVLMYWVQQFGTLLAVVVLVPLAFLMGRRAIRLARMIQHLRLKRISIGMLQSKMENMDRVAVLDLLDYEGRDGKIAGIPGAVRVDPGKLRAAPNIVIPKGVDLVLYCSSRNEFVSARVAEALQSRGIPDVWVLEGGLEAWILAGLPVTTDMPTAEDVAARIGIVLPPEVTDAMGDRRE